MNARPLIPPSPAESEYAGERPREATIGHIDDPIALFAAWLAEASAREPNDANAMTLATVDDDGLPDARMVLLKDVDPRGFVFYTNSLSAKGGQLAGAPRAALVFHWKSLRRQVRARGPVSMVEDAEADAYFATRARSARIGAWASEQSAPLADPLALERRLAEFGLQFGLGPVPRPPHWRGYRLEPVAIEFWRDRPFRLHERRLFTREKEGWTIRRLYP